MSVGALDWYALGNVRSDQRRARFQHAAGVNLNVHELGRRELRFDASVMLRFWK